MCGYDKVLRRLVRYRQQINMTQENISKILCVTQSQYSKMELGKTIISYNALCELKNHDWDIDFIITGNSFPAYENEITKFYDECAAADQGRLFELFYWVIKGIGIETEDQVLDFEWNYLKQVVYQEMQNIYPFVIMREIYHITQIEMSDLLGVNIKKYRELERGIVNPDAQLLMMIYEKMGCRPVIFMEGQAAVRLIINDIWMKVDEDRQDNIMEFVRYAMKLFR